MVGERGPELIQLPRGSKVKTNEETKQMMEQQPSQNITYITVEGNIDRDLYEDIMSEQDTRLNTKLAFSGVKGR